MAQVAGAFSRDFLNLMNRLKNLSAKFLNDRHLNWVFILPSAILLALFALPLLALFVRSISDDFFGFGKADRFHAGLYGCARGVVDNETAEKFGGEAFPPPGDFRCAQISDLGWQMPRTAFVLRPRPRKGEVKEREHLDPQGGGKRKRTPRPAKGR